MKFVSVNYVVVSCGSLSLAVFVSCVSMTDSVYRCACICVYLPVCLCPRLYLYLCLCWAMAICVCVGHGYLRLCWAVAIFVLWSRRCDRMVLAP